MIPVGYDTEFFDNRHTLSLISIGLCAEGKTYYAVDRGMPIRAIMAETDFLMPEVWPQLPLLRNGDLNYSHPDVKPRDQIAAEVKEFLAGIPDWRLVADCAPSDGYAFYNLFEKGEEPPGWDWWVYELRQEALRLGVELPEQELAYHHALNDAAGNLKNYKWLQSRDRLDLETVFG